MNTIFTYTTPNGKTIGYNVVNVPNGYMPTTYTIEYQSFVIVHHDHTGFVIGSRGATVKQIGRSSRTWVHVMPGNEFSSGHPWFIIKGKNLESVSTAHHYITTIAMEAQNRLPRTMSPLIPLATGPDGGGCELTTNDRENIAAYWKETDDFATNTTEPPQTLSEDDYMFDAMLTDFQIKDILATNCHDMLSFMESMSTDELDSLLRISSKPWHFRGYECATSENDIEYPKYSHEDRMQLLNEAIGRGPIAYALY